MRDRASVNGVATRTMKVVFPDVLDVSCYSHTIDLAGDKFRTSRLVSTCLFVSNLDLFIRLWISLFSHSPRAKLWWKERTGKAMASYSTTRWWSNWEVMSQVMTFFGDILPFLKENPELSSCQSKAGHHARESFCKGTHSD